LRRTRPALEDERNLEQRDDDPDGVDAHYIRESSEPEIDERAERSGSTYTAHAVNTMTRR
jgi:hypothetical protein